MKTRSTSNFRPLLRAFYAFLIASAVLWAMPRNAHAQRLFVTSGRLLEPGFVSEYDARSGEVINTHFIRGLNFPTGLVVFGNILFVANSETGTVGKYDATTGGAINPGFITGLKHPFGLAVTADFNLLWVSDRVNGTVSLYSTETGSPRLPAGPVIVRRLNDPSGLAVFGKTLFVADTGSSKVGQYDAFSGKVINASFITNLPVPVALAVAGHIGLLVGYSHKTVGVWDGKFMDGKVILADLITGLDSPEGLALFGDALFVVNNDHGTGTVGVYDAITGAAVDPSFITGLTEGARGIAVSAQ